MIRLDCHHRVELDERVWLKENDDVVCEDCHIDEMAADFFDNEDHGSPYTAGAITCVLEARGVLLINIPNEGAIQS